MPILTTLLAFYLLVLTSARKNLIVDTDLFSDCDDAGALLLAATSPEVNLLGVNINSESSYSVLAASAILAHYGKSHVPIGARRHLNDVPFFDNWSKRLGEYASKLATHWPKAMTKAEDAWDAVALYRKLLFEAEDGSVTIASVGFLHNLSGLLNSTADAQSTLTGPELVEAKVKELVVMGGDYPDGYEFNFWGDNPYEAAHVINNWEGPVVYAGSSLGGSVHSGGPLMADGPKTDPVRGLKAYAKSECLNRLLQNHGNAKVLRLEVWSRHPCPTSRERFCRE
ncbi:Inosine-uridine preferring nucleoside hydrolase [Colletotrichum sidae]|uniref:Inosine-uridine preferring nucleoside hydrolase n=1 Tax=Colletotrichum sidae TaxID=1347389 RepID=A0A4R8TS91_9PEZI|nr:Inosine-uridine preferring nucleoside hydrolase [Colletotrichum sidae]